MIPIDWTQLLSTAGGTGIALVVLYFGIKSNELKLSFFCKRLEKVENGQAKMWKVCSNKRSDILHRVQTMEDCFEQEVKEVKEDVELLCLNTNAIIQHLLMTTDRTEHPNAAEALEAVLEKKGRGLT